jgi:hypothetical protein
MTAARVLLGAVFASSLVLSGCGKLGDLEQPAPLYGAKAKADYAAKQRAAAEAKARAKKADSAEPDSPNPADVDNPPLTQAPYAAPLPGINNLNPPPPPGALPNPGTAPN